MHSYQSIGSLLRTPFPAAVRDLELCYRGLVDVGVTKIALSGDSAGGNLVLVLASILATQASANAVVPVGVVAFSPITDLALTGESYSTRAEDDLYFTRSQVAGLVRSYLRRTDCSVVVMDTETGKTPSRR
jgi:epsilon-lactone hydrolase